MDIKLSGETCKLIEGWIAVGAFRSVEEVIQAGVQQLGSAEEPTMESLRAKIQEGLEDLNAERSGPLDLDDFLRTCHEERATKSGR